jgi:hypothetical protein
LRVRGAANGLLAASRRYGDAPNAAIYASVAELALCVSLLLEWRSGVLSAVQDAQRFQVAARERAVVWSKGRSPDGIQDHLLKIAALIGGVASVSEVAGIAAALAAIPVPVGLYSEFRRHSSRIREDDSTPRTTPVELTVAFLKFTIDGKPLAETHFVSPGEMHDLDIEVRVSRWPADATALILEPVTIEHADAYKMPVFSLAGRSRFGPATLDRL